MVREVKLRIVLQNPIEGVLYGLQKGKGANYESLQPQLGEGKDLTFEFSVQVKQANSRGISLTGPSVQGPAGVVSFTSTLAATPDKLKQSGMVD
jgi:hypothetical protein